MEEEGGRISVNLTGHEAFLAAGQDITKAYGDKVWLGASRPAKTRKWLWEDGSSAKAFLADKLVGVQPAKKTYLAMSTSVSFSMFASINDIDHYYLCEIDLLQ